jgi:hypothetical protein
MIDLQLRGSIMQKKIYVSFGMITILMAAFGQAAPVKPMAEQHAYNVVGHERLEVASADGKYRIGISGLLQENNRFKYNNNNNKKSVDIELNRASLAVYGSVLDHRLTFLAKTSLQKKSAAAREFNLIGFSNYYVNLDCDDRYFQLRIGKFVLPFSRQLMTPSAHTQFYNPDNANKEYSIGDDTGIMFHNSVRNPFEWALAAVKSGLVVRLGFNQHHIDGYDQVDWTGGHIRFGVGLSGYLHTDYVSAKLADARGAGDFIVKIDGFSTNGSFLYQRVKQNDNDIVQHNLGGGADLGYLIKNHFEPVARLSWHRQGDGPHNWELLGGLNYYIHRHNLKLQAYAGVDLVDKEINQGLGGLQIQLAI